MSHSTDIRQSRQRMLVGLAAAVVMLAWFFIAALLWSSPLVNAQSIARQDALLASTPSETCVPSWNIVSSPNPSSSTNYLRGLDGVSSNDIWAVGTYKYGPDMNGYRTLIMHWDGIQWSVIPSPNPNPDPYYGNNDLINVVAIASNDVWAVGNTYHTGNGWRTLIEHWNGVQWSVVPSPNVGITQNRLTAVSAVSANDVWAVGYYVAYVGEMGYFQTLVEHWDGVQWSVVPSPNIGSGNNQLWDVSAVSPNDVWAVGYYRLGTMLTLIQHWDGTLWSVVPSPNPPGSQGAILYGVSAVSSNDVWAVGDYNGPGAGGDNRSLIEYWDGNQWSIVPSPSIEWGDNFANR